MPYNFNTHVRYLKGVGLKRAVLLKKIGIYSIEDILYYFPRRYEDHSNFVSLHKITNSGIYTVRAKVLTIRQRLSWRRRGFSITEALLSDGTGKISAVWFNQTYLKNYFKTGVETVLYGKVELHEGKLQIKSAEFEIIDGDNNKDNTLNLNKMVPVYVLPEGISQRYFRKIVKKVLEEYIPRVREILPYDIRKKYGFLNLAKSILTMHFPRDEASKKEAYRRLSFEEFFLYQIPILMRKIKRGNKRGITHKINGEIFNRFISSLPFELTGAQKRALEEIKRDMSGAAPMQRLLQGEVASGKTVLAAAAACIALDGGYQAAFMVPTEILARQHYENIRCQMSDDRCQSRKITIALLASSINKKEKNKLYKQIEEGGVDLVIGTHSLLEESLKFNNLGLVIIDEQHKFGVGQRALLPKKGNNPDCLIMTATPIPRTLSFTIYGDLDISLLDELPKNRLSIDTVLYSPKQRKEAYSFIKDKIEQKQQAYIICPNIEESDFLGLRSIADIYAEIKNEFSSFNIGLIHGKMNQIEQDKIMSDFQRGVMHVLVATTVLEVGVDVPNACVMLIEEAQMFGLSQLHQLRGRIGRGGLKSYCLLIAEVNSADAQYRLKTMLNVSDGFKIAEEDLRLRGPGEFFGKRQHGLTELRIADPLSQMHLLKNAREEAAGLLAGDPELVLKQNLDLRNMLKKRFPEYEELIMAG
ncbi:MAG: ATP-dependent DNA helicase RecG [Candidatus Omnitrophica bacterium CG11_big_fil_rev_8_21_14_0_20_42_13]|uniref:ATP-dependent DNA helicase RecG n=1 Tax=Candidatus Ghiorseimicrobium undicola TaxID=1974746 RepID=A0A2H0LVZ1_9BACT|nr:MAG: ATP-dependent DNA helicase RecG [Candidatus Omnitrophica bacterium CG11_big_fil_rev_8_21_14_0_20_42_13]